MRSRTKPLIAGPAIAAAVLGTAGPARALEPPTARRGPQIGVRAEVARPVGAFTVGAREIAEVMRFEMPVALDVGYRFEGLWFAGISGAVGGGVIGSDLSSTCGAGDCSIRTYRLGGFFVASFRGDSLVSPWLGFGGGYTQWELRIEDDRGEVYVGARGFELPRVLAGLDLRLHRLFGLGLYAAGALGVHTTRMLETAHTSVEEGTSEPEIHGRVAVGLRAVVWP